MLHSTSQHQLAHPSTDWANDTVPPTGEVHFWAPGDFVDLLFPPKRIRTPYASMRVPTGLGWFHFHTSFPRFRLHFMNFRGEDEGAFRTYFIISITWPMWWNIISRVIAMIPSIMQRVIVMMQTMMKTFTQTLNDIAAAMSSMKSIITSMKNIFCSSSQPCFIKIVLSNDSQRAASLFKIAPGILGVLGPCAHAISSWPEEGACSPTLSSDARGWPYFLERHKNAH